MVLAAAAARPWTVGEALHDTQVGGGDWASFTEAARRRLRNARVDPDFPHSNL